MNGARRTLRYQKPALARDYARAGAGLAMTLLLLLLVNPGSLAFYVICAFALIFFAYAGHTYLRQSSFIELDDAGAARRFAGLPGRFLRIQTVSFDALDRFSLRYFGRRRDRGRGIVELTIGAGRARFTADQGLEEFDALVRAARRAATARGIALDPATEANLSALGYR